MFLDVLVADPIVAYSMFHEGLNIIVPHKASWTALLTRSIYA